MIYEVKRRSKGSVDLPLGFTASQEAAVSDEKDGKESHHGKSLSKGPSVYDKHPENVTKGIGYKFTIR